MTSPVDDARTRASARRIGWLVGLSSALLIVGGVAGLIGYVFATAHGGDERRDADRVVVDVDRLVPWIVVFGLVAVIVLGLIAWASARSAVRPLSEALRLQRNFVADASHELRTPLAALVSRTQILQRRADRGQPLTEVISALRRDAEAMSEIVTDLLTAAAPQSGGGQETGQRTADLGEVVVRVFDRLRPLADDHEVDLVGDGPAGVRVRVPEAALTRACLALVDNAIDHSPAGSRVSVTWSARGDTAQVRVADQGPGIEGVDRDRVFQRFARGTETGRRRGYGLGLYLVREIASRCGGSVDIETDTSEGTAFVFTMPADGRAPDPTSLP